MSAAQPARSVAADLMVGRVHDAGRAVGGSMRGGRVLHGPDGEVETVVEDQAVRLGRRREGRQHLARVGRGCHVQVWLVLKFGIPHGPGLAKELEFLPRARILF